MPCEGRKRTSHARYTPRTDLRCLNRKSSVLRSFLPQCRGRDVTQMLIQASKLLLSLTQQAELACVVTWTAWHGCKSTMPVPECCQSHKPEGSRSPSVALTTLVSVKLTLLSSLCDTSLIQQTLVRTLKLVKSLLARMAPFPTRTCDTQ